MTTVATPTSELEAVNTMLATIGESPVSSLEVSGIANVAIAKQVLSEVNRDVQTKGWHFNTEINYALVPSVDGFLYVPSNVMKVDTTKAYQYIDVTQRGNRLYDRDNHTFVFTSTVEVDMVVLLPFTDIPEPARYYITIRAARTFQKRVLGSDSLDKMTAEDEAMALSALNEAEGDEGDYNMFNGSWSVANILQRDR